MSKFSHVNYDSQTETVEVGAGVIWDKVYEVLEPLGRIVVGGRTTGVGVAGFTLGGGQFSGFVHHNIFMSSSHRCQDIRGYQISMV